MDYQFSFDLLGQPFAKCELEVEAFGDWLSNDIGPDMRKISALIDIVLKLQNRQLLEYQYETNDYYAEFDSDEVVLHLNHCQISGVHDEPEDKTVSSIQSGCGLADLLQLLQAWSVFVAK